METGQRVCRMCLGVVPHEVTETVGHAIDHRVDLRPGELLLLKAMRATAVVRGHHFY